MDERDELDLKVRMMGCLRMAEDALNRANDQLGDDPSLVGWEYLTGQIKKAQGWVEEAAEIGKRIVWERRKETQ